MKTFYWMLTIAALMTCCASDVGVPPQPTETIEQAFSSWQRVPGGCFHDVAFVSGTMIGLDCTDVGSLRDKSIKVRNGAGNWLPFPGYLTSIASDGQNLMGVSGTGQIWAWNSTDQVWRLLPGAQGVALTPEPGAIAVYASTIYVIGTDFRVYQYRLVTVPSDGSASYWEVLQPDLGLQVWRISTNATRAVTVMGASCGFMNLFRHPSLPGTGWTAIGGFNTAGCFHDVTSELPGSVGFEQYWAMRAGDLIPRQFNASTNGWDPKPLPGGAYALRLVGDNAANRVLALGQKSDPQGNLWLNQ